MTDKLTEAKALGRMRLAMIPPSPIAMRAYVDMATKEGLNAERLYLLAIQGEANWPKNFRDFMASTDPAPSA